MMRFINLRQGKFSRRPVAKPESALKDWHHGSANTPRHRLLSDMTT